MNREQFLNASGLEATTLDTWIEQRWIIPTEEGDLVFTHIDVARAHLIHELSHDMGANDAGVDIILHLMDQLHELRYALAVARGSHPAE